MLVGLRGIGDSQLLEVTENLDDLRLKEITSARGCKNPVPIPYLFDSITLTRFIDSIFSKKLSSYFSVYLPFHQFQSSFV